MKIGLVSAILEDYDFKKMIDTVSGIGYECVEVACWPKAKAERRYAGVSHIDVANLGDKEAEDGTVAVSYTHLTLPTNSLV